MQQAEFKWGPPARAILAAGPRACEALLLRRLDELFEEHGEEVLTKPIRVVVPSKSLRLHVLERVLTRRGRAVAGLDCRTHHGLALDVTERAGAYPAISTDLFPLFARRLAHRETPLRRTLDHLKNGYASILSSVGDLLDAGLDPAHLEALEEVLEAEGPDFATPFEVERAKSLVRVAVGTTVALGEQGLGRSSHLLQAATALVKQCPDLLPSSAVLVYGYNDATGLVTDFLLALVQTLGGEILLDDPPDPIELESSDTGVRFAEIYRERVEATIGIETRPDTSPVPPDIPEPPRLKLFRALGGEAEVREVAGRIRTLLESGVRAERIGVVTRRLGIYRRAIRTHFDRLGVPFSGVAQCGPKHPSAFRVGALLEVLEQHEQVPIERWLDARRIELGLRNDLELGLHTLGIARLVEAAGLDVRQFVARGGQGGPSGRAGKGLRLPIRTGFEAGDGEPRAVHRYLPLHQVEAATTAARRLKEHLARWSAATTLEEHLRGLQELVDEHLGWSPDSELSKAFRSEVDGWSRGIPGDFELDFHEFASLLSYRLEDFGATALGGRGGGVQVLEVVEARSRTFEHLFLLGLNRGVFPRVVQEDALLPDRLREVLSRRGFGVLPDLHRKLPGFDEERYLFAQLMASSPNIVVSWLEVDDEHVFRTPSPLVERLRWSHPDPPAGWQTPISAPPLFSEPGTAPASANSRLRPAVESATVTGIFGTREQFAHVLEAAELESRERFPSVLAPVPPQNSQSVVSVRLRVLNELDPVRGSAAGEHAYARLGPYFGFVGPPSEEADPRRRERLFVTTLESVARCPWRTFVEKVLRVEKLPDPLDVLPSVNPVLIGNLVHSVLESIVDAALPGSPGSDNPIEDLAQARQAEGSRIPWPETEEFERILETSARAVAFEEGITLPGFDRVLADVCRGHLESARALDWIRGESRFEVLASEVYGEVAWSHPSAIIGFKADRVDRADRNGDRLIFTDYKTGKGLGGDSQYRRGDRQLLVEAVRTGERLQAAVYARAGGGEEDIGRYAFLKPSLDPDRDREVMVRANDEEIGPLLDRAIGATLRTWQRGAFFPRLVQHHQNVEPVTCSYCSVAEACLRGDSGSRGRLRNWVELRHPRRQAPEAGPGATPEPSPEAAPKGSIARTWFLPDASAFPPAPGAAASERRASNPEDSKAKS